MRHGVRARVGVPVTSVHPEASIPRSFMRFLSCVTESSLRFSSSSISTIVSSSMTSRTGCHERTFSVSIYLSIYLSRRGHGGGALLAAQETAGCNEQPGAHR